MCMLKRPEALPLPGSCAARILLFFKQFARHEQLKASGWKLEAAFQDFPSRRLRKAANPPTILIAKK